MQSNRYPGDVGGSPSAACVKPEEAKPEPVKPMPTPVAVERSAAAVVGAAPVTASPLRAAPASVGRPVVPIETPRTAQGPPVPRPPAQRPIDTPHLLRRERRDESRGTSPIKKSAYLLLALLLAVCVLWLARPKHSGPHPTVNSSAVKPVVQTPEKPVGPASSAWPTRAVGPPAVNNSRAAVQNSRESHRRRARHNTRRRLAGCFLYLQPGVRRAEASGFDQRQISGPSSGSFLSTRHGWPVSGRTGRENDPGRSEPVAAEGA